MLSSYNKYSYVYDGLIRNNDIVSYHETTSSSFFLSLAQHNILLFEEENVWLTNLTNLNNNIIDIF